jgi:hypothetical protein
MKESLNFNIHDIVTFQINREQPKGLERILELRDLNFRFAYFSVAEEIEEPDLVVNIGPFAPSHKGCYIVDHLYHVKANYLYSCYRSGRLKWEMQVIGFEDGRTMVNLDSRVAGRPSFLFPDYLLHSMVISPILEYKLNRKGYCLLHGAALSRGETGFLMSGREGAFKSTLVMEFVRRGYSYLGDDLVILKGKRILGLPTYLKEFGFRYHCLPTEKFRNIWDKVSFMEYQLREPFDYREPGFRMAADAPLNALCFVGRSVGRDWTIVRCPYDTDAIAQRLVLNNILERRHSPRGLETLESSYYNAMQAYSFVYPQSEVASHDVRLKQNLRESLCELPVYELQLPKEWSADAFGALESFWCKQVLVENT